MKLTFRLRFHTQFGQSLWLGGRHAILGGGLPENAIPLRYLNGEFWETTLVLAPAEVPDANLVYHYVLRGKDGSVSYDWGSERAFNPAALRAEEILVIDSWTDAGRYENAFHTEPFRRVLLRANRTEVRGASPGRVTHTFRVKAPLLVRGQTLCLLGEGPLLGNWTTAEPLLLSRTAGEDAFSVDLDLAGGWFPLAYKYGLYDTERRVFLRYEDGSNRILDDAVASAKRTIVNDGFAALPSGLWKGAGVAIPVFSLRSESSFGVGEFADLKRLADWCERVGLKLIQVLPINDTTATHTRRDSYPYSAISAFALHPLYLDLRSMTSSQEQPLLDAMEAERRRLNALETLDYEAVMTAKMGFLNRIYPLHREATFRSAAFKGFFERNKDWLVPYAVFCHLRDQYGTADFNQWGEHRQYNSAPVVALATASEDYNVESIAFHYFIQYHLHRQLQEATEYARSKGVVLKGDIPIGVYRYGADAWQQPDLYYMEMQAGAPPDAFAAAGQNWSFPTYNWPRMKETGFDWWKRRFRQMEYYFDAFRIDHILGFFRIWSIPMHAVEGIMGYFVPAIPVQLDEFQRRGIRFERERLVRPYITDEVLGQTFGAWRGGGGAAEDMVETVKQQFLEPVGPGQYALRPEFATQRQVERHFAALEQNEHHDRLKQGLYDLISNVVLFEAPDSKGTGFHFRFAIEKSLSFTALDAHSQAQLKELYIDYFFRRQDGFWRKEAMDKLPALKRVTNMLVCGEDLGLVPACVPGVMGELGLLSLEVQRMPKKQGQEFSRPHEAPYLSVVTPSTHDMSTIRGWWEEDRGVTQRFFNRELGQPGEAPAQCAGWINEAIVNQHLASSGMWSIFQLQDLLGMDERLRLKDPALERINIPSHPEHYWRYRMHLTLEKLMQCDAFNDELRGQLRQHGR